MQFKAFVLAGAAALALQAVPAHATFAVPATSGTFSFDVSTSTPVGQQMGYGASPTFALPSGGPVTLNLSGFSPDGVFGMSLYLLGATDVLVQPAGPGVQSGNTVSYTFTGLSAGQYSADVFAPLGSVVKLSASYSVSAVPEAGSTLLAAAGALVALGVARRRAKQA
jgi:hypothetical protein